MKLLMFLNSIQKIRLLKQPLLLQKKEENKKLFNNLVGNQIGSSIVNNKQIEGTNRIVARPMGGFDANQQSSLFNLQKMGKNRRNMEFEEKKIETLNNEKKAVMNNFDQLFNVKKLIII